MLSIANEEPMALDQLLEYQQAGQALVATSRYDSPVAYVLFQLLDDSVHIEQVSVHPDHQRLGIGRRLA
jgi:ribosomal protein S18 acetylase RimI-like enzyme